MVTFYKAMILLYVYIPDGHNAQHEVKKVLKRQLLSEYNTKVVLRRDVKKLTFTAGEFVCRVLKYKLNRSHIAQQKSETTDWPRYGPDT